nr:hypothetical protein [Clavibacter michiganensis]
MRADLMDYTWLEAIYLGLLGLAGIAIAAISVIVLLRLFRGQR